MTMTEQNEDSGDDVAVREAAFAAREADHLRRVKPSAEIEFRVEARPEDRDIHEDACVNWVALAHLESDIERMHDPDEIVLPAGEYILNIDYPVAKPAEIPLSPSDPRGYSRAAIAREVAKVYAAVYEEEERTSSVKVIPPEARGQTYNRNETDGKYGIWGHDIEDLALVKVRLEEAAGMRYLRLIMYS